MINTNILSLFPVDYKSNLLPKFINAIFARLDKKVKQEDSRIAGKFSIETYNILTKKYSELPLICENPTTIVCNIAEDFFQGIPRWRSPYLQYTVGAAVNTAASALYSIALDENVYNINSGLAGNCLAAEQAVTSILSKLANIQKEAYGLFTFGGTATNLYAIKVGTRKAAPLSGQNGLPKNMKLLLTEDSHFSHSVAADWLGIGTNNIVTIKANKDRTTNIQDAEKKMNFLIEQKNLIPTIIINGGTTYSHTVDDIEAFVKLRDSLVKKFNLNYKPHIHVDSVIGWVWLFFSEYDFEKNHLQIGKKTLEAIKNQYEKIKNICTADSWGIDFHKGVGACPVDCSVFMCNNKKDLVLLSKTSNPAMDTHQLAQEFSFLNPSEYTLETSRAGAASLSALASIHTLGLDGYRRNLANLIEFTIKFKDITKNRFDIAVLNYNSNGYVSMLRLYPPNMSKEKYEEKERNDERNQIYSATEIINKYNKTFFEWDFQNKNCHNKHECSFTSSYIISPAGCKIAALKFYPVSPHTKVSMAKNIAESLIEAKCKFDKHIWNKRNKI